MIGHFHHRGWHYLLFLAIASVLYFANLGGATLWDLDEGRNGTCSGEMMASGNWVIPTFNGDLRVDKPALLYWLQIASYYAFGVNEFSARLPSAFAALLTVLLCYELTRSMFSRSTGLLAGVIVSSTPMLCGAARFANPDALLNACTVLSLTLFWVGLPQRRWYWFVSLGAATGLAVLAKGLVGLVLPAAVVVLFLFWERQLFSVLWDRRWHLASTTFVLVAWPWYIWVGVETKGEFLRGFFLDHHLRRATATMENHSGFPGYYVVVLLVGTAPWSIFLLAAWWYGFWSTIRQPWSRCAAWWSRSAEDVLANPAGTTFRDAPAAYRLLACWVVVYCLFFSAAATKLPNYVLPTIVPCAILMARFLQRWRTGLVQLPNWLVGAGVLGLLMVGITLIIGMSIAGGAMSWAPGGRTYPGLEHWAWLGVAPLLAAPVAWWCARRRRINAFIGTVALTAAIILTPIAAYGSAFFNQFKAPQPLVEQVGLVQRSEDIVIACYQIEHLPSLSFYVQRHIIHFGDERQVAPYLRLPMPVYMIMRDRDWQRLQPSLQGLCREVGRHHDLYQHLDLVVVTNQILD